MTERWELMVCEERDDKKYWHRVGVMFRNKSGDGFNIMIPPGVSISGRVAAFVPKSKDDWANETRARQGRPPRGADTQRALPQDHFGGDPGPSDDDIPL